MIIPLPGAWSMQTARNASVAGIGKPTWARILTTPPFARGVCGQSRKSRKHKSSSVPKPRLDCVVVPDGLKQEGIPVSCKSYPHRLAGATFVNPSTQGSHPQPSVAVGMTKSRWQRFYGRITKLLIGFDQNTVLPNEPRSQGHFHQGF